ncbi:MAG: VIT domain-containing protein [Gemmatimonadaceae bacterium]
MRALLSLFVLTLFSSGLPAQGLVLSRPCAMRPCLQGQPCAPCRPQGPSVTRQSSDVRAELVDRVLRFEITETFVNRGSGLGEADYIFPLPGGAAFQDLKLSINGELVSGELMDAGRARQIYEQIVRQQRDPALVEWMGYGMLRARIFPIAPGEVKKVVVRFQMVAEREGDALRVDYFRGNAIPGVAVRGDATGGRGMGGGDDMRRGDSREISGSRGSFVLVYPTDPAYGTAYSPTHSIATDRRGSRREVRVNGDASEITLLVPVRRSSEPAISVLTHASSRENGFALITLSPPSISPRVTARDVTLVLDASGSMSGVKIRQARAAGRQVLATLSTNDRFRLIDFSTDVRSFRDDFVRATPDNIAAATRYLETVDASGSTNISGALDAALEGAAAPGRLNLVLFVTDGEPTVGERRPDAIASRVALQRGNRRIFSFGVGADLNAALVERLAVEGRGTAHFVRPEEDVERVMSVVVSRLTNPVVTDLRVSAEGVRLLKRHPTATADIFAGQDYVMLARYDGSGVSRIRFDGQSADGPVSWSTRVSFPSTARQNAFVARLWATQRVGYLSAEKRKSGASREVDDEIRELGEKYAIPTEFSSYLVLEPGMTGALDQTIRRGRAGGAAVAVGVTGSRRDANAAITPSPAAPAANVQSFEAARASAMQRSATTLGITNEADFSGKAVGTRRAGTRSFTMRDGIWTDTRKKDSMRVVKVRPYSASYFKLIELIPELAESFALGDRVIVAGRAVAVEVAVSAAERLSDLELRLVQAHW